MSTPNYRRTQIGWVTIGSMVAAMALPVGLIASGTVGAPAIGIAAFFALMLLLFGWLSVEVDDAELRARFGIGLIGKTIALTDVRAYSSVENPWYWGWGIRFYPGGTLYNVSGYQAVEVLLKGGKRVRIGTAEPEALVQAIRGIVGEPKAVLSDGPPAPPRVASKVIYIALAVALTALVAVGVGSFVAFSGPATVAVTPTSLSVKAAFYGVEVPLDQITEVSLARSMPRILKRTNGFAAGGTLRGHFDVDGLGKGQLFIEEGHPPFVFVRTTSSFLFVNDKDPARTEEIHKKLTEAWTKVRPK